MTQLSLWLAALVFAALTVARVPTQGCIAGLRLEWLHRRTRWAACWTLTATSYSVAFAGFGTSAATAGCVPGAAYHEAPTYMTPEWWCE